MNPKEDKKLGKELVSDELFDLTLYKKLAEFAKENEREILNKLIPIETRHLDLWQKFFDIKSAKLNLPRRVKLAALLLIARAFGRAGIHTILQAIEVYGIKKYLSVWKKYKNDPIGESVKGILLDEFKHEDDIVSASERTKIHPERVRDIFLGFNDGLVEILGAVSGFFAAFGASSSVLIASLTVAVAGSISMAASAFAAQNSQKEVETTEIGKKKFLGENTDELESGSSLGSATIVGISYFIGSLVPIIPVIFGAVNVLYSVASAAVVIVAVSYIVSFLSGMDTKKRIATNLVIIAIAVSVTYTIATFAKTYLGIEI